MTQTFLHAEWRKLVMANYAVDKGLLEPYLPYKTEIDTWNGTCYVSLVGFMFLETKVLGMKIPFHVNFEEVNLRFYVRYKDANQWKRGVVFIKEIVPKPALSFIANLIYHENYETQPMTHSWSKDPADMLDVEYRWKKGGWNSIRVSVHNNPVAIHDNSEEAFITEHYWGYTRISSHKTSEYRVEHPKWEVYPLKNYTIDVDFAAVYGENFRFLSAEKPRSVFLAEGSEIQVKSGRLL